MRLQISGPWWCFLCRALVHAERVYPWPASSVNIIGPCSKTRDESSPALNPTVRVRWEQLRPGGAFSA